MAIAAPRRYCVEDAEHVGVGFDLRDVAEGQRDIEPMLAATRSRPIGHDRCLLALAAITATAGVSAAQTVDHGGSRAATSSMTCASRQQRPA